jgi:hypothetical protein
MCCLGAIGKWIKGKQKAAQHNEQQTAWLLKQTFSTTALTDSYCSAEVYHGCARIRLRDRYENGRGNVNEMVVVVRELKISVRTKIRSNSKDNKQKWSLKVRE